MGDAQLFPIEILDRNAMLRKLATAENALEIGKAAEHLVVADLILQGYRCYLSDQGLPYDMIVDVSGHLIRVQCKACCFAKNVSSNGRAPRNAYSWNVRKRGKFKDKRLTGEHCDVVALVALDVRMIGYLRVEECGSTVQIAPPGTPKIIGRSRTHCGLSSPLDSFTFPLCIKGIGR